jgi:dynein heavy chain
MNCGVDEKPTVFLISDTQIVRENFLEDLNNVLNNGDIPNLFSASEDFTQLIENMREQNK